MSTSSGQSNQHQHFKSNGNIHLFLFLHWPALPSISTQSWKETQTLLTTNDAAYTKYFRTWFTELKHGTRGSPVLGKKVTHKLCTYLHLQVPWISGKPVPRPGRLRRPKGVLSMHMGLLISGKRGSRCWRMAAGSQLCLPGPGRWPAAQPGG